MLGLRFCARALSSRGKRGPLFIAVRGPLTIAASPAAEHRLQTRRLSSCGSRTQLLRGMWDPPRPGLEPTSPAPAGRLSTTAPPGKPTARVLSQESGSRRCGSQTAVLLVSPGPPDLDPGVVSTATCCGQTGRSGQLFGAGPMLCSAHWSRTAPDSEWILRKKRLTTTLPS